MEVKVIHNFLSDCDCDYIIERYGDDLVEQTVLGEQKEKYRVALGKWLNRHDDKIIQELCETVAKITDSTIEQQELPHFVRYLVGGEYKPHHDFFHENTDYYESCVSTGGQRKFTCILYLNDDFEGGETDFPNLGKTVKPKQGTLCCWENIKPDGEVEHDSIHAGLPVISGVKNVLIIWIRETNFI